MVRSRKLLGVAPSKSKHSTWKAGRFSATLGRNLLFEKIWPLKQRIELKTAVVYIVVFGGV